MPPAAPPPASGIRGAYEALGVHHFYEAHGHEYENPHDGQIVRAVAQLMAAPELAEAVQRAERAEQAEPLRVLDLSCGSGEATLALEAWAAGRAAQQTATHSQQQAANRQRAQQQARPRRQQPEQQGGPALLDITASDPFTQLAYQRRTGRAAHGWSFQDIADGCLAGRVFDLCVCSFALHLCDPSSLFITLYQLACHCRWLAVLAPHKQPAVREEHGWAAARALKVERVHVRLYRSLHWGQGQLE